MVWCVASEVMVVVVVVYVMILVMTHVVVWWNVVFIRVVHGVL